MLKNIKKILRKNPIWIKISYSNFFQKIRNPKFYQKQIKELSFYNEILKDYDNKIIFDVGANIGSKSLIFSNIAQKVISFEPTNQCITILKNRGLKSSVKIIQCALSSKNSFQEFFEVDENSAYSSLSDKHILNKVSNDLVVSKKKINTYTLDHFIKKEGMPSYIKIDVEGYEKEVINGLSTPVNLISFESNLPEFLSETIDIINYLEKISNYEYNFTSEGPFVLKKFVNDESIIHEIEKSDFSSIEIFARLI